MIRVCRTPPLQVHSGRLSLLPPGDSNQNISEALLISKGERILTSGGKGGCDSAADLLRLAKLKRAFRAELRVALKGT